jgi:hypothetical protein
MALRTMTVAGGIILVITLLLWAAVVANCSTLNTSDPAGNALSSAYGAFMVLGLWILLAILLVIGAIKGDMPGWSKLAAVILVPASGASALAAMNLMSGHPGVRWPLVIPVLAPLLLIALSLWSYFPAIHSTVPSGAAGAITWGSVLLLSLLPLPTLRARGQETTDRRQRIEAEWSAEEARQQELKARENLAKFQLLTAESRLWDYMPFTWDQNPLREQALERARSLPSRQADAEQMLGAGHGFPLLEVQSLNLSPTPSFCARAGALLVKHAEDWRTTLPSPPEYESRSEKIEQYLGGMGWLRANGCDLASALSAMEATVRSYAPGPGRELFLQALARLGRRN